MNSSYVINLGENSMNEPYLEIDPFKGIFGLDNLAERISEILKCPVTIEDANHRLLAYSTHDERTDPARIATIIGRRVPEKVINSLWREGSIPYLLNSDEPLRIKSITEVGLGDRVAISIRKKQETLGFIWALEIDHSLEDKDLHYLKMAGQAVKNHLLNLHTRKTEKEESYQEFFWQLLTGHLENVEEIKKKFKTLNLLPPEASSVLVFKFPGKIDSKTEKNISYILKTTQRIKVLFYTLQNNNLIVLASPKSTESTGDYDKFIKSFIIQMNERFGVGGIKGGCGTIHENCQRVEKSYQEALTLLELKDKFPQETEAIYSYQELGIYLFIPVLLEKRKNDGFENQYLKCLFEYDFRHKTQLYKTLEVYLENDSRINETANLLHIHANTLSYRLKRISEIGEINLDDYNQKMALFIDIKINKFNKSLL